MGAIVAGCNFSGRKADVAYRVFLGLSAVQHRGEQYAAIVALFPDRSLVIRKKKGLVGQAFHDTDWSRFDAPVVVGLLGCNYPQKLELPIINHTTAGVLIFEGQLSQTPKRVLRSRTEAGGYLTQYMNDCPGAYGLVAGFPDQLFASRDPRGIRQLVVGADDQGTWVVATESTSLDMAKTQPLASLGPGQVLAITAAGPSLLTRVAPYLARRSCILEPLSRMKLNSVWEGREVASWRAMVALELARGFNRRVVAAIGIPREGDWFAQSFAADNGLNIPWVTVIYRDRYYHSADPVFQNGPNPLGHKFSILENELTGLVGKSVVIADGTLRSGKTVRWIAAQLKKHGIAEVHAVIFIPPLLKPCMYGIPNWPEGGVIDCSDPDHVARELGLDSVTFPTIEQIQAVLGHQSCSYCLGGKPPITFRSGVYQQPPHK